jgi:hypothetical protein
LLELWSSTCIITLNFTFPWYIKNKRITQSHFHNYYTSTGLSNSSFLPASFSDKLRWYVGEIGYGGGSDLLVNNTLPGILLPLRNPWTFLSVWLNLESSRFCCSSSLFSMVSVSVSVLISDVPQQSFLPRSERR